MPKKASLSEGKNIFKNILNFCLKKALYNDQITFTLDVRGLFNSISTLIYQTSDEVAVNKDEREKNKNMESLVNATLSDYDISLDSIDMIFLTGGMAKCFLLRAALYEIFQKPIISPSDPFYAVSRGASLVNRYKSIDESSFDLMPNAVMMDIFPLVIANVVFVLQRNFCADNIRFTRLTSTKNYFICQRLGLPFYISVCKVISFADGDNVEALLDKESRELPKFLEHTERIHNNRNIFFGVICCNAIVVVHSFNLLCR